MKLITWNTAMKFRSKIEKITPYSADLLIIPECEGPEKWLGNSNFNLTKQFLWFGDDKNKGLAIISLNSKYHITLHPSYSKEFRYIIPLIVSGNENFILFAIWTQNTKTKFDSYIGQLYRALIYYNDLLEQPCILAGDWNSNKIFDHIKRVGTHSQVVELLKEKGITSAYHHFFKEEHGLESRPTHYFRKEKASPFHIDFVFISENFKKRLGLVKVGSYTDWIKCSDHLPIYVELLEDL